MSQLIDTIFWYPSLSQLTLPLSTEDFDSHCQLRIFFNAFQYIVIVTELESNQGSSITHSCDYLVNLVCHDYRISPHRLVWIEENPLAESRFHRVLFSKLIKTERNRYLNTNNACWKFAEKKWISIAEGTVDFLAGQTLSCPDSRLTRERKQHLFDINMRRIN
jgi:hypothetical protein